MNKKSLETITLSIVSEIYTVLSGRRSGSLQDQTGSIHRQES